MTAEQLARRLGGVRSGRQWKCRCVAHEDRAPSMIIFDGRETVQVRCMAGCATADIIAELKARGLWDNGDAVQAPRAPERDRVEIARWLWRQRQAIDGTVVERYLREVRGISCALPPTLGYLPARGEHPAAMIAAFSAMAFEPEPGVLAVHERHIFAVHLTKLSPTGAKLEKIMVGSPSGMPIVLSPFNDLLGLAICEGIEDGLSIFEATGLAVWAAGAASLMGLLGDAVKDWVDCVTVLTDDDKAGRHHAARLVDRLLTRGIHAEMMPSRGGAFA